MLLRLIWLELGTPTPAEYVHILEGTFLLWMAIGLGASAPYLTRHQRGPALSLALLFFFQALFRWGFCLHIKSETWIRANEIVPFLLSSSVYLWVGMRCREVNRQQLIERYRDY